MKIAVIASYAKSLINFRRELLGAFVNDGHSVIACAPGENQDVTECLKLMNIEYRSIKLERTGINPFDDIKTIIQLRSLFREINPDIVLSYTIKPVIFGSLAARLAHVRNSFSIITGLGYVFLGDNDKQKIIRFLISPLYKLSLSSNKAVFFQNPDDRDLFFKLNLVKKEQAVLINGSGVNLDIFRKTAAPVEPLVFLLISRLIKEKGIHEYVEAAKVLKRRFPEVKFWLLGPIDNKASSINKELISQWQTSGVIDYLGETRDVRPFIARSSVYVLPSYREGTPRSVLEAMAMGRPIITTDVPGCRETVENGENGILVPAKDVNKLVEAMEKFILSPELVAKMGEISRKIAEVKYDVHDVNRVLMQAMGLNSKRV